jgi:ParB family chromosome partitioning protein
MTDVKRDRSIVRVPIAAVTVPNSRKNAKNKSAKLVQSIGSLGLKRPITVSRREKSNSYQLVCGEGRLDAFSQLGQAEIPAIITDLSTEDCILMSLVENIARRRHSPVELVSEIGRLAKHYRVPEIAKKLDLGQDFVRVIVYLLKNGERRLVSAVERGIVPPTLALEIAKAKSPAVQAALLETFAKERRTARQIALIRQLVEQRQRATKRAEVAADQLTPEALGRAYRQEMNRRQLIEQTAELAHGRLMFIIGALRTLLGERMFSSILRDQGMDRLPLPVLQRMSATSP